MIIAIDGPAGSGKTTIAKLLARRLEISYLDTGATYRALTLKALEDKLDLAQENLLADVARALPVRFVGEKVYLGSRDVSKDIRTPQIDKHISVIVAYPKVRQIMVDLQRRIASCGDFVVEGRDITTVVFPKAEYKFFMDGDFSVRVERRFAEMRQKGLQVSLEYVSEELKRRDHADMNRTVGPLRRSSDAIVIDTTHLTIGQVVEKIAEYIKEKVQ